MTWTISFDAAKCDKTLRERGLDFADAAEVFTGLTVDFIDERIQYGEERYITIGHLKDRMVVVVWTDRQETRHIIS